MPRPWAERSTATSGSKPGTQGSATTGVPKVGGLPLRLHVTNNWAVSNTKIGDLTLARLPIQTREDVKQQVKTEGSLLKPNDGLAAKCHSTSGSSGTPVQFYVSSMNGEFNTVRSLAQFLLEGNDLSLNLVRFALTPISNNEGLNVVTEKSWLGPLDAFIKSGSYRIIQYFHPDMQAFQRELERLPIGYLVAAHWGGGLPFYTLMPEIQRITAQVWYDTAE